MDESTLDTPRKQSLSQSTFTSATFPNKGQHVSSENQSPGFAHRFGWLPLFPIVLVFTAVLKFKNRKRANDKRYLEHQVEFFSFAKRLQSRLGYEFLRPSDKFYKQRGILNDYALAGQNHQHVRVLDVATGCGFQAKALRDAGSSEVYGIDIVAERINEANQLFDCDGICFIRMDAAKLAFPDNSFDSTTISCALHDMPTQIKRQVIAEMVRVTRPLGSVVIFEPRTIGNSTLGYVLGMVGEILDESINMREYVMDDLNSILEEHGLQLIDEQNVFLFKMLNIKHCRVCGAPISRLLD